MSTDTTTLDFVDRNTHKETNKIMFKDVVLDGFKQTDEGDGFEYIVGTFKGGDIKIVYEPKGGCYDSIVLDGVNGMNYALCFEDENLKKTKP